MVKQFLIMAGLVGSLGAGCKVIVDVFDAFITSSGGNMALAFGEFASWVIFSVCVLKLNSAGGTPVSEDVEV